MDNRAYFSSGDPYIFLLLMDAISVLAHEDEGVRLIAISILYTPSQLG